MEILASSMPEKKGTDVHEFLVHHTQKFFIHFFSNHKNSSFIFSQIKKRSSPHIIFHHTERQHHI